MLEKGLGRVLGMKDKFGGLIGSVLTTALPYDPFLSFLYPDDPALPYDSMHL